MFYLDNLTKPYYNNRMEKHMNTGELAKVLGVTRQMVYKYCIKGMPFYVGNLDKKRTYLLSEVRKWLDEKRRVN